MAKLAQGPLPGGLAPRLRVQDYERTTLKPRHRPVVRAFGEALFTDSAALPPARLDALPDELDDAISNASKTLRFGLTAMLDVVRLAPLFVIGKLATFDQLPLPDRVRMLEKMETSSFAPLQLIFVAYKTALTMLFFEVEEELSAMGYSPERQRYRLQGPTG